MRRSAVIFFLGAFLLPMPSSAGADSIQRGHALAKASCASCHAIEKTGASPLTKAPPFRTLDSRYPIENLAEAFAEGVVVAHSPMPEFQLEPQQIDDLIAYLKSIREP